jgi:hypothetical protein
MISTDLAAKAKQRILTFRFTPEMTNESKADDCFVAITYKGQPGRSLARSSRRRALLTRPRAAKRNRTAKRKRSQKEQQRPPTKQ